jgi:hypothetical protein
VAAGAAEGLDAAVKDGVNVISFSIDAFDDVQFNYDFIDIATYKAMECGFSKKPEGLTYFRPLRCLLGWLISCYFASSNKLSFGEVSSSLFLVLFLFNSFLTSNSAVRKKG